jgi:hypothetical protein
VDAAAQARPWRRAPVAPLAAGGRGRGARELIKEAGGARYMSTLPAITAAAAAVVAAAPPAAAPAAVKKTGPSPRRGPGRPPSKPPAPPLELRGIVDGPKDPNNRLEFVYGDPSVFKALFTYFKNIKAREIHLRCAPRGLTFFARDHSKTSRVVAHVAGEHVNWHYCEDEYWLGINRENVEKMFTSIDKTLFKITLIQTHEDPTSLTFVFKDADIDKECNYRVTLSAYGRDEDLYEAERVLAPESLVRAFPIEFVLSAKQFKKSISDALSYSDTINFEKLGSHPLQLTYARANMTYNEVYRAPEKIKLRSAVADGQTFRCTAKIANVKSLAASMVTDDVRILCREEGDILFRSALDAKALVVSTMTRLA